VYRVLVGKPEGKRPLGRPRRRWVDNIRMDLQEVGCGYVDSIELAQDRDRWRTLVSAVMNLRVLQGISWLAANQLAAQEGLCTMEWVSRDGLYPYCCVLHRQRGWHILRLLLYVSATCSYYYETSFTYSYSLHASVRCTIIRGNIYRHITNYCKDNVHQGLVLRPNYVLKKVGENKKYSRTKKKKET